MRRHLATALVVLAVAGCEEEGSPVSVMDGGEAWTPSTPDGAPRDPTWVVVDVPAFGGTLAIEPSASWTSPLECPPSSDDAYCEICWSWFDSGPHSLHRDQAGDEFGHAVAVGDFNGDGYPDLAVGAPGETVDSQADAGAVYVYLGTVRGFQPWTVLQSDDGGVWPDAGARFGATLLAVKLGSGASADLLVGYGGPVDDTPLNVFEADGSGLSLVSYLALSDLDPDGSTVGTSGLGAAFTSGDFDGDGDMDVAAGAPTYEYEGVQSGAVFLLENDGDELIAGGRLSLEAALTDGAGCGTALGAGDVTGSGHDEILVGCPGLEEVHHFDALSLIDVLTSAESMVEFGSSILLGDVDDNGRAEIVVGGHDAFVEVMNEGPVEPYDDTATAVRPVAIDDFDLDGNADLFTVHEPVADDDFVLVFYGGDGSAIPGFIAEITGGTHRVANDAFGTAVVAADVDGDALLDLVVGAPGPSTTAGRVLSLIPESSSEWHGDVPPEQAVTQELGLSSSCDICAVHGWTDGTACDGGTGDEICVFGACVERRCGDGYRQDGVLWTPREGCDDGNAVSGDACSSTCVPTRLPVSSREGAEDSPAPRARAVAEDGTGDVLFVYTADLGETRQLRARRFNYGGAPDAMGSPAVVLAADVGLGWDAQPSVAGLAGGGWIVTWTDPVIDGDGAGIALCRVDAAGLAGPVEVVNTEARGSQHGARVASRGSSWAVAWVDEGGFDGPLGSSIVRGTAFDSTGAVIAGDLEISDPATTASQPAIIQSSSGTLFVWTEAASDSAELSYVMGQRLGGGVIETFTVAGPYASQPTAVVMPDGSYLVAWVRRDPSSDWRGDIQARPVAAAGDPLSGSTIVTVVDEAAHPELAPSIAPLVGSEYLVAYEDGGARRGLAFAHVGMGSLASEASTLAGYLTDGLQGDVTLLRTTRGIWFAWSDAGDFDSVGDPEAYRSFYAFLLPPN